MKRLICGLLSFIMCLSLLTACDSKKEAAEEEPVPQLTETEPAQDVPEEPDAVGLHFEELPEIGDFVDDTAVSCYFEDGIHDVFTPREDYGRLVSYYSDLECNRFELDNLSEDENETETETVYGYSYYAVQRGLAAVDGRRIMEGLEGYCEEFSPGEGIMYLYNEADEISLVAGIDGSWCMETDSFSTLFTYGMPCFIAQTGDEAFVYDLNGEKRVDLSSMLIRRYDVSWLPDVIYAGEDLILFRGLPDEGDSIGFDQSEGATAVGMDGKIIDTLSLDSSGIWTVFYLGGKVIAVESSDSLNYSPDGVRYRLCTVDCKEISEQEYNCVYYDKSTNTIIAKRENTVEFFSGDGRRISPPNKWNSDNVDIIGTGEVYTQNKLFFGVGGTVDYYDIFGNKLTYDVPGGKVRNVAVMDYLDPPYLLVATEDMKAYVCSMEGKMLFEIACPYYIAGQNLSSAVIVDDNRLGVVDTVGILHIYSLSDGSEELVMDYPFTEELFASSYPYLSVWINGNYMVLYDENDTEVNMRYSLYYIPDGRLIARDLIEVDCESGCAATASLTHSAVYSPEGKTIMRFRFDSAD